MMTPVFPSDIDDLAAADDRRVALGYVTEAFAEAILAGIESDSFAHAALFAAFQELVSIYGTTFKELIHEEFGDGIMSAIDFKMDLQREADPKGDRVNIVMSGKYLQYKMY